jgi:molybdenum cofactor synthesis domain-containing protein
VVSLVVIGNEVLAGKVVEQNATFLIDRMKTLGVRVREIVFVEDDVHAIAEALQRVGPRSDEVLVTGGIGPTHDDVTIQAAALALGVSVVEDLALVQQIERIGARGEGQASPGERRLARVPEGATLVWGAGRVPWPAIRAANLWLLPGVPVLLQMLFEGLVPHFSGSPPLYSEVLELSVDEATICERLDAIVAAHETVEIGSYPRREAGAWRLRLTFDSHDQAATQAALEAARAAFSHYC